MSPKYKHRRRHKNKLPIGASAGAIGTGLILVNAYKDRSTTGFIANATGMDQSGHFHWDWVAGTWAPLAIGVGISVLASKVGVNRRLHLPFFKV